MDCYSAAASLKKLLVVHSAAETQVSVLGKCFFQSYSTYTGTTILKLIQSFTFITFILFIYFFFFLIN